MHTPPPPTCTHTHTHESCKSKNYKSAAKKENYHKAEQYGIEQCRAVQERRMGQQAEQHLEINSHECKQLTFDKGTMALH
jgi:hypothetical protein